jgi:uncharacterized protein (DUF1501 family)
MPFTTLGRRDLLKRGALFVALGLTAPSFVARTAAAAQTRLAGLSDSARRKILVVVQLGGGNDGLNTVVPFGDDAYYKARPNLAIPRADALPLVDGIGLNPALKGFADLYGGGRLAIVQGAGYPNPNRSHFRAMDIWQTAQPERYEQSGWLGRYLDASCCGEQPRDWAAATPAAVSLATGAPRAFWNEHVLVPSIPDLEHFQLQTDARERDQALDAFRMIYDDDEQTGLYESLVRKVGGDALHTSEELKRIAASYTPGTTYPTTQFSRGLQTIAQLINADLGARVFYISLGGFDTHSGQKNTHARLLQQLGDGLAAFYADLDGHGHGDRVVTLAFSEFGRRVAENASGGTDHGAAEPLFVFGPVKGGLVGAHPSLTDLDAGDLKHAVDFRSVYATLLDDWLGASPSSVLGGDFAKLGLLR